MFPDRSVILSMYVTVIASGMFLRGPSVTDGRDVSAIMERNEETLAKSFGPLRIGVESHYFGIEHSITLHERERWDELIDWMEYKRQRHKEVLNSIEEQDET